jgi:Ca2+/Na+ antiporter
MDAANSVSGYPLKDAVVMLFCWVFAVAWVIATRKARGKEIASSFLFTLFALLVVGILMSPIALIIRIIMSLIVFIIGVVLTAMVYYENNEREQ